METWGGKENMKKVFTFAVLLAMASTTAFAGTAVFNGIPAPFGNDAAPVLHPALVAAATTLGVADDPAVFGVTLEADGAGWDVVNWVSSTSWQVALSETGVASNAAVYSIIDTEDYEIVYNFTIEDGAYGPAPYTGNALRLSVALTFSNNFGADAFTNHSNIDYSATAHEGDKMGLEWQGTSTGLSFRAWQAGGTGPTGGAVAASGLTWGGQAAILGSADPGRVLPQDIIGKQWTIRITRDKLTGDTKWYLKIEGLADFLAEKLVMTLPGTVVNAPLFGGAYGNMGTMDDRNELTASILTTGMVAVPTGVVKSRDIPHFRFRGHLGNFTAVVSGDAVADMNASLLGAEGVPSIQAPFFAE
jgi:hypothetical protein